MKILSIIIPIYNTEKYLKKCISSLLNAKCNEDIEILLINDGSEDKSNIIINNYANIYPETIRVFNKKNGGHGSVINFGINHAKGLYFKILDSDDYFNSKILKKFISFLKINQHFSVDLFITPYKKCFKNKQINQFLNLQEKKILFFNSLKNILLSPVSKNYINYIPMAMLTYRTILLKKSKKKLLEKTYYVDNEFIIYFMNEANNFIYLKYLLYNYNIGHDTQSISSKNFILHYDDHLKVIKRLIIYYNAYIFKSIVYKKLTEIILLRLLNTQYLIFGYHLKKIQKNHVQKNIYFDNWLKKNNSILYNKLKIRKYIIMGRNFKFNKIIYRSFFIKLAIIYEIIIGTWKKYNI